MGKCDITPVSILFDEFASVNVDLNKYGFTFNKWAYALRLSNELGFHK